MLPGSVTATLLWNLYQLVLCCPPSAADLISETLIESVC
jgi:hypothetical protein